MPSAIATGAKIVGGLGIGFAAIPAADIRFSTDDLRIPGVAFHDGWARSSWDEKVGAGYAGVCERGGRGAADSPQGPPDGRVTYPSVVDEFVLLSTLTPAWMLPIGAIRGVEGLPNSAESDARSMHGIPH